ncbi:hypothetical protein M422DRAFT_180004 [Sphaerobolus stellatus SS14]|uniref:Heme haloperoxidase family profile domain-containing protein n=1 Tax=Sphaerobolus stellatus (strain SS14) TaxID=990650 RepID=A0A0C9VEX0_SPHS4|nr:hypothetical protein M422DRAFT_180004 [Sphaerobolus stellatus SS14]
MAQFLALIALSILALQTVASPHYQSLSGLSERELAELIPRLNIVTPPPPPAPPKDTSVKLVNDKAHPWMPLREGDIRGPCPGMNTLASHGYLPRNGIVTPAQIVNALQDGYGAENAFAIGLAYASLLVDGNPLTNLFSIGAKSPATGPDPPKPAIVGGLNGHNTFEGDASFTRDDFEFGDNHSFNQTLFNQFVDFSNRFGGGNYNLTVAGEYRFYRVQQSIAQNPHFSFTTARYITAYRDIAFPTIFFVDGRKADGQLNLTDALGFFRDSRFPNDFHRIDGANSSALVNNAAATIFNAHPIQPGGNNGTVNSFTVDTKSAAFTDPCGLYTSFVDITVGLYPNPQGVLRRNLNANLGFLYQAFQGCPQRFPFGQ